MHRFFEKMKFETIAVKNSVNGENFNPRRSEMEREIGQSKVDSLFQLMEVLHEHGDISEVEREVFHTAYFKTKKQAKHAEKWLNERGYKVFSVFEVRKSRVSVMFSHVGPTFLESLYEHEKTVSKLVGARGGTYDGWETSIEHEQPDRDDMERNFHRRFPWHRGNIPHIPSSKMELFNEIYIAVNDELGKWIKEIQPNFPRFATRINIRHYVHLKTPSDGVPTKLVFRLVPQSVNCTSDVLRVVQNKFDEIIGQERFQAWRDFILHVN
jgi:hypothetical protein